MNGKEADLLPFPVTMQVLERGQERYNIYCTPCHSRVGNGEGMIVQRGYKPAANFHEARLLAEPVEPLLLCNDQRLWRHARLFGAIDAGRPLVGCGVYPGAAVEPERHRQHAFLPGVTGCKT